MGEERDGTREFRWGSIQPKLRLAHQTLTWFDGGKGETGTTETESRPQSTTRFTGLAFPRLFPFAVPLPG